MKNHFCVVNLEYIKLFTVYFLVQLSSGQGHESTVKI